MGNETQGTAGSEWPFDEGTALTYTAGSLALLHEIMDTFRSEAPHLLATLQAAMAQQDVVAVEQAVHRLKGSASYLCASGVCTAAEMLEEAARRGDLAGVAAAWPEVQRQMRVLCDALTACRSDTAP